MEKVAAVLYRIPKYVATAVAMVLVLYLTLFPDPVPDMDIPLFPGVDKAVHAVMFLGVAGCLYLDFMRSTLFSKQSALKCFCFAAATLFGGLIEIMQGVMNMGRSADVWDFVADAVGALVGVLLACRFLR